MNLVKEIWTKEEYQRYLECLKSLREEEYKKFHQKLVTTKYEILGLRVPLQRKIAKEISKGNYESFLSFCKDDYYEEVNIEGFVIGFIKKEEEFEKYFVKFISKIDNWAICDGFCSSLKLLEKNPKKYFPLCQSFLSQSEEFSVRVGLVLLLNYYVKEEYIDRILATIFTIEREEYYINMALAWLIAECFIKFPEETLPFIKKKILKPFPQNKAISKIHDSYRVSKETKEELKQYRIV